MESTKRRVLYCKRCGHPQLVPGSASPTPCTEECGGRVFIPDHPSTRNLKWVQPPYGVSDSRYLAQLNISNA